MKLNKIYKELLIESLVSESDMMLETEIARIKAFEVNGGRDMILPYFEMLYELEYKYNQILNNPFRGNETRKENIVNIIASKAKELISKLVPTLLSVFKQWVNNHNTDDMETFTNTRVQELIDSAEEMRDIDEGHSVMSQLVGEYKRYGNGDYNKLINIIERNPEQFPGVYESLSEITDEMSDNERADMEDELSNGLEYFNDNRSTSFETEDEAQDYIDGYTSEIEIAAFFHDAESLDDAMNGTAGYYEIFSVIIAPLWRRHWEGQVSEHVYENQEIVNDLEKIETLPLKKQFGEINKALNATHANGSMMDHYENEYGVTKDDLDALSNYDVDDWNKELRLIGTALGGN